MARLTDKIVINNKFAGYCAKSNMQHRISNRNETNDITNTTEIINKCGQLEDIEEELGIDLITLFKALKNGIYVKACSTNGISGFTKNITLSFNDHEIYIHNFGEDDYVDFEDYNKTWALTKEELEK